MSVKGALAALVLCLLALPPGTGAAGTTRRARLVEAAPAALFSDGHRYAAWPADNAVRVLDTVEHRGRTLAPPTTCTLPGTPEPMAIGAGRVLWQCPGGYEQADAVLERVSDGALQPISLTPALVGWSDPPTASFDALGREWVTGRAFSGHGGGRLFLNWHTGEIRRGVPTTFQVLDIDRPTLTRNLCAPLSRNLHRGYAYIRPYGVDLGADPLTLARCGTRRRIVLSRCLDGCAAVQLTHAMVSWGERRWVRIYIPRTGRRARVRAPAGEEIAAVVHTRRALLFTTSSGNGRHRKSLWRARIPRRLLRDAPR